MMMAAAAALSAAVACAAVAVPATADAACAQVNTLINDVAEFNGTASASYVSGSLSTPDQPGVITMSIDHSVTNVVLPHLANLDNVSGDESVLTDAFANEDGPTGGSVSVNDSYVDTNGPASGTQTGSGPTLAANNTVSLGEGADDLYIDPSACTYQLEVSYGVATQTTGDGPTDPGIDDLVSSPAEPIPANLVLAGSTSSLPISEDAPGDAGGYSLYEDNSWGLAFDENFLPTTTTASMTWSLTPTLNSAATTTTPTHSSCTVPKVAGLTKQKAEQKLTKAG